MAGTHVSRGQEAFVEPLKGYTVEQSTDRPEYVTGQAIGGKKRAQDSVIYGLYQLSTGNLVAAGSTQRVIKKVAHGASKNDVIQFETGSNTGASVQVISCPDADTIIISATMESSIAIGDAFAIKRYITPQYSSDGSLAVASGPVAFQLDGVDTDVIEDTVDPTNNLPLPSKMFVDIDGVVYPVRKDTGTPSNTVAVPVELVGAAGPINITAGDLNVQLTDQGVNADATRIGDGTTRLGITLNNEAKTHDAEVLSAIEANGIVDTGNSTTTPLAGGAVFTGAAIEIIDFASICVAAISDVASATSGLSMQFSPDGVNWDHIHAYDVAALTGVSYTQSSELRYFRIVYTNGASAQSYFRLTTILKRHNTMPSRYTFDQGITGKQFADNVKAVIHGLTTGGGGGYVPVKVNPSGALTVESTVTSSALPTGAATETTLSSLLTELQLKADLTETQPVSVASLPLPTGAATEATLSTRASEATLSTRATEATQVANGVLIGATNETAPATDTGLSGLNGRLQRIAQNITTLIGKLPSALGIQLAANSLSVAPASDAVFITKEKALTGTYAENLALTTVVTFTAPTGAVGALVQGDDANASTLRVKQGAVATASSGIQIQAGRSEKFDSGTDLSICSESASVKVYVQWFVQS